MSYSFTASDLHCCNSVSVPNISWNPVDNQLKRSSFIHNFNKEFSTMGIACSGGFNNIRLITESIINHDLCGIGQRCIEKSKFNNMPFQNDISSLFPCSGLRDPSVSSSVPLIITQAHKNLDNYCNKNMFKIEKLASEMKKIEWYDYTFDPVKQNVISNLWKENPTVNFMYKNDNLFIVARCTSTFMTVDLLILTFTDGIDKSKYSITPQGSYFINELNNYITQNPIIKTIIELPGQDEIYNFLKQKILN